MEIGSYNIYETNLTEDILLKVDCSYDDVAFIILEKEEDVLDSFEITSSYLASFSKAIVYVLNNQNKNIKITRNVTDDPNYRFLTSYYNETLSMKYQEDGNEEVNTEMEVKISQKDVEKIAEFFTAVYQCEISEKQ